MRREQRPITRIRQEIKWPCRERIVERGARLIGRTCGNACRDRRTEKERDHAPVHGLSHVAPPLPQRTQADATHRGGVGPGQVRRFQLKEQSGVAENRRECGYDAP